MQGRHNLLPGRYFPTQSDSNTHYKKSDHYGSEQLPDAESVQKETIYSPGKNAGPYK
jgi:hypothetical protein